LHPIGPHLVGLNWSVWMGLSGPVCLDLVCLVCLDPICLGPVCLDPVCLDPVCLGLVCLDPVCLDPLCLDPVCLDPVCLDSVCLDPIYLDLSSLLSRALLPTTRLEPQICLHMGFLFPKYACIWGSYLVYQECGPGRKLYRFDAPSAALPISCEKPLKINGLRPFWGGPSACICLRKIEKTRSHAAWRSICTRSGPIWWV
jgi:hypothetical protein